MSRDIARSFLLQTRLYQTLNPGVLDHLAEVAEYHEADSHEVLFFQEDPCPGVFIVGEGRLRIATLAPNGKEHLLRVVKPGGSFLEVPVISGAPAPATAETMAATRYIVIPRGAFRDLLHNDHAFCLHLLTGLSGRILNLIHLLEDLVLKDAVGRIASHLHQCQDASGWVHLPGSKKDLASHLNLTPETLSRAMRRLRDAGVISDSQAGIHIEDLPGLEVAATGDPSLR